MNDALYTIRSSRDLYNLPINSHGRNQIRGSYQDLFRSDGLHIDINENEEIRIDYLEISHVLRPLTKIGNGKVHIGTLHLHTFGGDGIRIWGSNLTIDKLIVHSNKKALPYNKFIIEQEQTESGAPSIETIITEFSRLRIGNTRRELPLHDLNQLEWQYSDSLNAYYVNGEHIDAGFQAWIPPFIENRLVFTNKSIDSINKSLSNILGIKEIESFEILLDAVSKVPTRKVYRGKEILGIELLTDPENLYIKTSSQSIASIAPTGTKLIDVISSDKLFDISNKYLPESTHRYPALNIVPARIVENIIIKDIKMIKLHRESQIFMLSESNLYRKFTLGSVSIKIDTEYFFWLNAISLSDSTIGNSNFVNISPNSKVRIGKAYSVSKEECDTIFDCIKPTMYETDNVSLINVGDNAYPISGITSI